MLLLSATLTMFPILRGRFESNIILNTIHILISKLVLNISVTLVITPKQLALVPMVAVDGAMDHLEPEQIQAGFLINFHLNFSIFALTIFRVLHVACNMPIEYAVKVFCLIISKIHF